MTDQNYEKIIKFRMEKAKKALEKNNMQVFIADNKNEVLNIVKTLIKKGGRNTLRELTISQLKDADTPEKH